MSNEQEDYSSGDGNQFRLMHARQRSVLLGFSGLVVIAVLAVPSGPLLGELLSNLFQPHLDLAWLSAGPLLGLCTIAWSAPMAWTRSVSVRIVGTALVVTGTLAGLTSLVLTSPLPVHRDFADLVFESLSNNLPGFLVGIVSAGAVSQLWLGWSLAPSDTSPHEVPATSIRSLLELTFGVGLAFALHSASAEPADNFAPIGKRYVTGFCFATIGSVRLAALSPKEKMRVRSRWIISTLILAVAYVLAVLILHEDAGYWSFTDWRLFAFAAMFTILFLVSSALPLWWLKKCGWVYLKRRKKRPVVS